MDQDRREKFESILLDARKEAHADLHRFEKEEAQPQSVSGGNTARFTGGADAASDVQEEEADFIQISRLSDRVEEIDEALRMLADDPDDFGSCRRCGETIAEKRLELVPWASHCASCAEELEKEAAGSPTSTV